jgi:hypothetical protein
MKRFLAWLRQKLAVLFAPRREKKNPSEDIYPLF